MSRSLKTILIIGSVALVAAACNKPAAVSPGPNPTPPAAVSPSPAPTPTGATDQTANCPTKILGEQNSKYVSAAITAFIKEGFTPQFVDAHLKNTYAGTTSPSSDGIVRYDGSTGWQLCIGEYAANISMMVNTTTGAYVDIALNPLVSDHAAHDLVKIISMSRAKELMKSCIGADAAGYEVLYRLDPTGKEGRLYLTATVNDTSSFNGASHVIYAAAIQGQPGGLVRLIKGYIDLESSKCFTEKTGFGI